MQTDLYNPNYSTVWGNEYYMNSTGTVTVNSSQPYVACRITPLVSKNVTSLQFANWGIGGSAQVMTVALQADSSGSPSGTNLTSGTITPAGQFQWNSVSISSTSVTAGTHYWIVISNTSMGTNSLDIRGVDDGGSIINGKYGGMATSTNGTTWSAAGGTTNNGCVGFGYSDSTYEGQAYCDVDFNTILNTTGNQWGEYFKPPSTLTVSAVSMRALKNGTGTPIADLLVTLQNADTSTTIEQGTLVTAASITQTNTWYTYTFTSNHILSSSTNYRIYLTSADTSGTQYQSINPKTTNTGNGNVMSFGGTTQVETDTSSQHSDHDVPFKFTLVTSSPVSGAPFLINFI